MKTLLTIFFALLSFVCFAENSKKQASAYSEHYKYSIIPMAKESSFFEGEFYQIKNDCNVVVCVPENLSDFVKDFVEDCFEKYWDKSPKIEIKKSAEKLQAEGYKICCDEKSLKIIASDERGVRHAMFTLRQLADIDRTSEKSENFVLPQMQISDYPIMKFRGIHLCVFPETNLLDLKRQISLAAHLKMNYVCIEFWGTYPYDSAPDYGWRKHLLSKSDIREIVKLSKKLGICAFPQFNVFGHSSGSTQNSMKHCMLDLNPQYAHLFEESGWSWCISNEKAKKMLKDCVSEMIEDFQNPEFFMLGFDEAYDLATCSNCRKHNRMKLIESYLLEMCEHLKKTNTRPMIWHDMLIARSDPRWKGYNAVGADEFAQLYARLPKDVVICDWQYGNLPAHQKEWETLKFFKNAGFDVLACPWKNYDAMKSQAETIKKYNCFGMIGSTWARLAGDVMINMYVNNATAQWGSGFSTSRQRTSYMAFMKYLRHIGQDLNMKDYEDTGLYRVQWSAYGLMEGF